MSDSSSTSSPVLVKRACDACRKRKVKCLASPETGSRPCKNCSQSRLKCTYDAIPQKKGPKGSRAKVISELRENQRISTGRGVLNSLPISPRPSRAILPPDIIDHCVDFFFAHVYPTQPILHRASLQRAIASMHQSTESYVLITALCAYMMIQPSMRLPRTCKRVEDDEDLASSSSLGARLLTEALNARKELNSYENPSLASVTASFFFFGCYFCLEKHGTAWFHLREATTLALLAGMHQEDTYKSRDTTEMSLRRRLFWLLFVTERAYALQAQKPLTLHDTIALPDIQGNPNEPVTLTGFLHLIMLFKPFDDTFVGRWNQTVQGSSIDWIVNLQNQLIQALPQYLNSTETQAVDLRTSQHWLQIMIWQLSISHRLLSSTASDPSLTFRYPVDLSRALLSETSNYSQQAMEVHGIGLTKKIFDVACTLVDVMACVPIEQNPFSAGPRDYLNQFFVLISRLRGGPDRYLPLLISKASDSIPEQLGTSPLPRCLPSSLEASFDEQLRRSMTSSASSSSTDFESFDSRRDWTEIDVQPGLMHPEVNIPVIREYP